MQNKLYIYFPLLVFLGYFGIDKACLSERVQQLTQKDPAYLFYEYKPELIEEMARVREKIKSAPPGSEWSKKKIFMVLGSSRLMFFSYEQFARNFPDWEIFNFSAPISAPAYYAYIMERALERGIRPDYVLIEADPYQFNESSGMFLRSNVAFSFDARFMLSNFNLFEREELSYYLARTLFAGFRYPPWPDQIKKRRDNEAKLKEFMDNPAFRKTVDPELLAKLDFSNQFGMLDKWQRGNRGCIRSIYPRENWYQRDFPVMESIAYKEIARGYSNYELSSRQFTFLENLLKSTKAAGVPVTFLRPQVSRPMQRLYEDPEMIKNFRMEKLSEWEPRFRALAAKYSAPFLDLPNHATYRCNTFVDASHMSLDCYHPMLVLVMRSRPESRARAGSAAE